MILLKSNSIALLRSAYNAHTRLLRLDATRTGIADAAAL